MKNILAFSAALACSLAAPAALAAPKVVGGKSATTAAKPAPAKTYAKPSEARHGVGQGDTELGFFLDYSNIEDANSNTLTVGAVFGKYLRDTLELRVTPVISYTDASGFKNFAFDPYVTLEKLFPTRGNVVPYVGGGIGVQIDFGSGSGFDTTDLGLFVLPTAGLKFFVSERISVEYALGYEIGFDYRCVDASGYSSCNTGTRTDLRNDLRFNIYF